MRAPARNVALVSGVLATMIVVLVAAIAPVVHPPAPPGISYFAPPATKPITKAPPGQASSQGSGGQTLCIPSGHL